MSKYQTRVFSKDAPCNKGDLWNCFAARGGRFRIVPLEEAKSIIGENVPRVIRAAGRAELVTHKGGSAIKLTKKGEKWLKSGVMSFIRNHPDDVSTLKNVTKKFVAEATA